MTQYNDPTKRHDVFFVVEAINSNPNGDPDMGNHPRVDPVTGQIVMTDVSIKRKVRDGYMMLTSGDADKGEGIFIQRGQLLVTKTNLIADSLDEKATNEEKRIAAGKGYFDIRSFGAVFTGSKENAKSNFGQKIGPWQVDFSRSILPVEVEEVTIVRTAQSSDVDKAEHGQIGRKFVVPHAVFVIRASFSPLVDKEGQVSTQDMDRFYESLMLGFAACRTTSKNFVPRRLLVCSHESQLGSAPRHVIEDMIKVDALIDTTRSYEDYRVHIGKVPDKVTLHDLPMIF